MDGYMRTGGKMPEPRSGAGIERLASASPATLFDRFMREFEDPEFADVLGHDLLISRSLFRKQRYGEWKIQDGDRAQWLLHSARGIREPDEIWMASDPRAAVEQLYYLARFDVGKGHLLGCLSVFERPKTSAQRWSGVTCYAALRKQDYWESKRAQDHQSLKYWRWDSR